MKKIIVLVALVFSYAMGTSQAITQRGTTAVTVQDARLFAQYNFRPPAFTDTVQANLQIGIDSCGALIYSRDINSYYYRACSPKRWVRLSQTITPTGDSAWQIFGNTGTVAGTNFLGTKDNVPLEFRVNNVKSGYIDSTNRNTALGFGSQRSTLSTVGIDTAQYNTSVGYRSLGANLYGDQNTAVGYAASALGTTGKGNTSVGYGASAQNRTSNYDAALGWGAMPRDYYGAFNVAIGANVNNMLPPSIGDTMRYNTFIGASSAAYQRAGRNNVFVGDSTGANNQTGSRNVLIGSKAGLNETGSDRLYISNSKTPNPLIKGNFGDSTLNVNGKMSISLTSQTPDSSLDVTGGVKLRTIYRKNAFTDSMLVVGVEGGVGKREIVIPSNTSVTRIISGSAVWDSLLVYSVTKCFYYINGILYNSAATNVTLAPADSSNPRIDVIYCDTLGNVGVITGIPSPNPVKPVVNPLSQIELTHIDVNAQATTPAGISKKIIYNENTGLPGEWTTSSTSSAITFNYPTNPYKDLVSAFFDGVSALNQSAIFTNNANVNADTLSLLSMYLRVNSTVASPTRTLLAIQLYKSGALVSTTIQVSTGRYGYNENILSAYQQLAIPFSDFTFRNPLDKTFDQIKITANDFAKLGFQIDYITAQIGGNPPPVTSNYWSLSGNDISSSPTSVLGTTSKNALSIVTVGQEAINIATDGLIKLPKVLSNTDTTNYKPLAINTTDGELVRMDSWIGGGTGSVTAVTGVAPVFSSGGTTPSISMSIASTNTDGYLTQGDWNIFNNKLNPADTISLSNRVNNAYNSVTRLSDTSFYLKKPNNVKDTILLGNSIVYAENPIMARVSNDSNIIYFNPDTANVWRGGGGGSVGLQDVLTTNNTASSINNYALTLNEVGASPGDESNIINAYNLDKPWQQFVVHLSGVNSSLKLGTYDQANFNEYVTLEPNNLEFKKDGSFINKLISPYNTEGDYDIYLPIRQKDFPIDTLATLRDLRDTAAAIRSGGGGGSGTVTSISQGYGITNSPNPIVTTGTVKVDTTTGGLSGKYLRIIDTTNQWINGSGTATRVPFWSANRTLSSSANMVWNTTDTSLGVSNFYSGTAGGSQFDINTTATALPYTMGIWRKQGNGNFTYLKEDEQGAAQHKWAFVQRGGFNLTRTFFQANSSIVNINMGWQDANNDNYDGNTLLINPTINITSALRTGTTIRGIYYNPTLTSLTNTKHIAFQSTSGDIIFNKLKTSSSTSDSIAIFVNDTLKKAPYPTVAGVSSGYYLSISDSTTQNNPTANTPRAVKFNVTDLANGFSLNTQTAIFVGTINNGGVGAGTTLNVTSLTSGKIKVGMVLTGGSITAGTFISAFISGSGGIGTYEVSVSQLRTSATYTGTMTSQIVCANTGIYNLQFSSQMDKTDAGVDYVNFWLRKNGTDITASSGVISLQGNSPAYMMAAWNYVIQLVSGDTIELYWGSADVGMSIISETAQTSPFAHPAVQSTIFTITQQSGILAGTGITGLGTSGNAQTGAVQTLATGTSGSDFNISSSSNTQTFNLPNASSSNRGALLAADWTTFNNKIGASDTSVFLRKTDSTIYYTKYRSDTSRTNIYSAISGKVSTSDTTVFQRKNIAAYSLQANNTASAANVTTQTYRDVAEQNISGTIAWVGTTAPSSLTSANYSWSQIGKTVTVEVNLLYANASAGITAFSFPLPSDMPTPVTPTGWSAASSNLFTSICTVHATTPAITSTSFYSFIRRDAANTGYELGGTGSAVAARGWKFTLTYKAQ